jgi:hypothetical protein
MEYFLLFVLMLLTPVFVNQVIFKDNFTMPATQALILPYVVIGFFVYLLTVIFNMIRALRTCDNDDNSRSWGLSSGMKLAIFSVIFAIGGYLLVGFVPLLKGPILAVSFLPYGADIADGFYLALGGTIGYWIGRIFIGLC